MHSMLGNKCSVCLGECFQVLQWSELSLPRVHVPWHLEYILTLNLQINIEMSTGCNVQVQLQVDHDIYTYQFQG